ncbi:MAG: hypothetical protein LLG01_10765 [Planctomycetaceae bacterium]|nr:hypothetical protein [Planctomycetaceae bacterium]
MLVSLALAAGVCGAAAVAIDAPAPMQSALEYYSQGHYARATAVVDDMLAAPGASERAWIIAAECYNRQNQPAKAIEAYQQFLKVCDSTPTRAYVLDQMRRCREAAPLRPATLPSAALSDQQRKAMAAVGAAVTKTTRHFAVHARNTDLATLIATLAEESLRRICGDIMPQEYPHVVDINVWIDKNDYAANAPGAPEWSGGRFNLTVSGGVVTRRIDLTQLNEDRTLSTMTIDRVLPHETCHLVLKEYFGDAPSPLFLNEGLAMLAEPAVDNDRLLLAAAALSGEDGISMDKLLLMDQSDMDHRGTFYAQSLSLTQFLHSRLGREQFSTFLGNLKDGCTVTDSLERSLCMPPDPNFLEGLSAAWQTYALQQGQDLRALETASR